jgi:hypothetical protein
MDTFAASTARRSSRILLALVVTGTLLLVGTASAHLSSLSIRIATPSDGQTISGHVSWEADLSGTADRVEFAIDGKVLWTEYYAPYVFNGDGSTLDTSTLSDGSHKLTVTAYPDKGSGGAVSASITVTVANDTGSGSQNLSSDSSHGNSHGGGKSSGSLSISIATPSDGQTISGHVSWQADVSGTVNRVEFAIDDKVLWTERYAPYVFNGDGSTLDTSTLSDGSHKLTVTGYPDTGSGGAVSASIAVTVANGAPAPQMPTASGLPTISGTATAGQTLTGSAGTWNGTAPIAYSYQWLLCDATGSGCSAIFGATTSTVVLTSTEVGSALRLRVVATNVAGSTQSVSAATAPVASTGSTGTSGTQPQSTSAPSITGEPVVGKSLQGSVGGWSGTTPMTYKYAWSHCDLASIVCYPIAGAFSQTYTVSSSDVEMSLVFSVTALNFDGSATASSAPTAVVSSATAPVATAKPTIGGSASVGQQLSASAGSWSGTTPMTYAYQWQRCDTAGASCAPIAGASSQTYTLVSADAGTTERVSVAATNTAGSSTATSAPTTSVVDPNAGTTFDSVSAYLDAPQPSLAGATVVTSASQFGTVIANAKAGDVIDVKGNVQIGGSFNGFDRVVSGGIVKVVFEAGAGFTGNGGTRAPAVYFRNSGGWQLWGGYITNPTGPGILVHAMPGPVKWTGFTVHGTGDTGVAVYPAEGDINHLVLKGVSGTATPNLSYDPHTEKGTGIHAWNLADATGGYVRNSTFAADTLDQATGAAVEIEGDRCDNVTVIARAKHLGFAVPGTSWDGTAHQMVAGNVLQIWGGPPPGELDLRYAEGNDIQGRILEMDGAWGSYSSVTLAYGRATGAILQNPLLSKVAYNTNGTGLKLGDVKPLP